ncbi:nostrin isoform X2 [Eleginops maclovinus]|uniref:nostrin isoform X2 n=1 Tax=Eleginops maclovinus TaxID=56733 RepID=UPI0030806102
MSYFWRRVVKVPGPKSTNCERLKMKDPISTCSYNKLYQNVKRFSKTGEYFCRELMTVFQQRAELELTYAKGLQKLAGKLIRASKGMSNNSTYSAWFHVSDEMYSRADAHRSLGNAFQQEAILEIRQVLDEHNKRKRPLDTAIERTGKLFTANWSEQLKIKKKLVGLTREHEALFNFVENNKQISTEKEKQKMLNRLTKSAEMQARVDDEYFNINMEGHQMRLKWENTLKNCHQEEDSKSLMAKDRRKEAIKLKVQRLEDSIVKTKKDREGIEKLMRTYSANPSFSNQKNLEETEQQIDESTLKLDLLEATHGKLSASLCELEGKAKSFHRFSDSIVKWKDKDCEHSVLQLTRPVKLRRSVFRSRQSLRASIIYKGPAQFETQPSVDQVTSTTQEAADCDSTVNGALPHTSDDKEQGLITPELCSIGKCKALYNYTPEQDDELTLNEGDLLDIYGKEENGWWFGKLDEKTGHFPSTYVEELPVLSCVKSSDA